MVRYAGTSGPIAFRNAEPVAAGLARLLAAWPAAGPETPDAAPVISVTGTRGTFRVGSDWLEEPYEGLTSASAACAVVVDLARSYLLANATPACIHCAAFEIAGRLVLLVAGNRAGKSTLSSRLCASGALHYCDDMLPLAPDNQGIALGIPPRLRLPLPGRPDSVLARFLAGRSGPRDERYAYLLPETLAPHGRTAPIGAVVLLDRRADGPAGFASAGRGETLKHLFLQNLHPGAPAADLTERLHAIMDRSDCLRFVYSDLDEAAELLLESFKAPRVEGLALRLPAPPDPEPEAAPAPPAPKALPDGPLRRAPGIGMRRVEDELFLVEVTGRTVLHLNPLAGAVWTLLAEPVSAGEIAETLFAAFPETPRARIAADLAVLLGDFEAHGLLEGAS